ncbi:hypothetical protein HDV00_010501 [Rhizophlyctis rosea]|nr:hypothetical protein HDV00_010501 [Rhizophlyctis rosea]
MWYPKILKAHLLDVGRAAVKGALDKAADRGDLEWVKVLLGVHEGMAEGESASSTDTDGESESSTDTDEDSESSTDTDGESECSTDTDGDSDSSTYTDEDDKSSIDGNSKLDPKWWMDLLRIHSPLTNASSGGHVEIVKLLLATSEESLHSQEYLDAALQSASSNGYVEVIEILLSAGANVNIRPHPLECATWHGHILAVKRLLEADVDQELLKECLYEAADKGYIEISRLVLGRIIDAPAAATIALGYASEAGHVEVVGLLLNGGADANTPALRGAVTGKHVEVAKLLLESGADVHGEDDNLLTHAVEGGCVSMVKLLLESGANPHAGRHRGLRRAARECQLAVVKLLLEHSRSVCQIRCRFGALIVAAMKGHVGVVKLLLQADENRYSSLRTALQTINSRSKGCVKDLMSYSEIVRLLEHKARAAFDINLILDYAVAFAILRGHLNSLILILKVGEERYNPVFGVSDEAFIEQHADIVTLLRSNIGIPAMFWHELDCALLRARYKLVGTTLLSLPPSDITTTPFSKQLGTVDSVVNWETDEFLYSEGEADNDEDIISIQGGSKDLNKDKNYADCPFEYPQPPPANLDPMAFKFQNYFCTRLSILEAIYRDEPFPPMRRLVQLTTRSLYHYPAHHIGEWFEWKNGGRPKEAKWGSESDEDEMADGSGKSDGVTEREEAFE